MVRKVGTSSDNPDSDDTMVPKETRLMEWLESDDPFDQQTDTIYTGLVGIQVAQVVGSNALDGLTVFGIVLDIDEEPVFVTEEAAQRLVACLVEALAKAEDILGH